jgi:hypothetical protein
MNYSRTAVFLIGIGIISAAVILFRSFAGCSRYACIRSSLLSDAKEIEVYERTNTSYRALLSSSHGQVRFSRHAELTETDAETLTNVTVMKIQGLFDNALSPYPGPLSSVVRCDDKYKPSPKVSTSGTTKATTFMGYLNDRLQYGSCVDNQLTHKGYSIILYCTNEHAWYHIELIKPLGEADDDAAAYTLLSDISCK